MIKMQKVIVLCDNCKKEIKETRNFSYNYAKFDLCNDCLEKGNKIVEELENYRKVYFAKEKELFHNELIGVFEKIYINSNLKKG